MNEGSSDTAAATAQLAQLERFLGEDSGVEGRRLGAGYQATVDLYETPCGDVVVKRARGPGLWRRLGESRLRREHEIYELLNGIAGVPRCLGLLDGKHLVLEYIPGDSYRHKQYQLDDRDRFFDRLLTTIEAMHVAGVAHGDLKRKDNLLVGPDERPYLIDFGLAVMHTGTGRPFEKSFFDWIRQYDYNAWIKHKYQRRVDAISTEDERYYRPMRLERIARAIRVLWQKLTLRRFRMRNRVR
ncbi:MAG TPA: hypothetical protein VIV14_00890 [Gammaproteobacteria bacterium]